MSDDLVTLLRRPYGNLTAGERAEAADRIEELEDALTKTEMIVRIIASSDGYSRFGEAVDLSCEYLAELTGGKDE